MSCLREVTELSYFFRLICTIFCQDFIRVMHVKSLRDNYKLEYYKLLVPSDIDMRLLHIVELPGHNYYFLFLNFLVLFDALLKYLCFIITWHCTIVDIYHSLYTSERFGYEFQSPFIASKKKYLCYIKPLIFNFSFLFINFLHFPCICFLWSYPEKVVQRE